MVPRIPLEVLEIIIDGVAKYNDNLTIDNLSSNWTSIKACALVCHSFLPPCRKHIFGSVTLNSRNSSSHSSDDLNRLLSNSPHLAVYIRKLYYLVNVNEEDFAEDRLPWLLSMFKKLVKLQKLSIVYIPFLRGRRLDWMSYGREVLLPLLHLPTLTSIRLDTIRNFALADLASCVNLKKMRIQSLECSNNGVGKFLEALPATPVMLEKLSIEKGNVKPVQRLCHARRPDGKPIIDFSSLKEIKSYDVPLHSMTELFGMCRNLHKITLIISPSSSVSTSGPNGLFAMLKPSLPTLVNIDIEYHICGGDETSIGPLAGLCHELEKMAGQNVVEVIELMILVNPGFDCTRWDELDDVLMGSPEDWPALREVSLLFQVFTAYGNDEKMIKALRELPMTKLVESKRVQFDFEVRVT